MSWSYSGKSFQSSTIKNDVSCGLFIDTLYEVEEVPFYSWFITFYHEKVLNSIKCLFCLYWDNFWNVFVLLLIWYIMLIDFCMMNYPCSPGINPTWMVHNPFYMLLIQFCRILLKIFTSIFIMNITL